VKFAFLTYGCKVNQYETQKIREGLEAGGAIESEEPEFYIINSCTITDKIDRDIRRDIRRIRKNTRAKIILTGCLTKRNFDSELADFVVPNEKKDDISMYPGGVKYKTREYPDIIAGFSGKNRAFVKIQDGCSNFCSYCEVPFVRGSELKSRPLNEIKDEIKALVKGGFAEIILTGINIGFYGAEDGYKFRLLDLLKEAAGTAGEARIRLSSIGPESLSCEMVDFFAENPGKMCPHFHMSMQSGCDKVLKLMRRKYTSEQYREKADYIFSKIPHAGITTDIIVGFPGETEADFEKTYSFVERINFSRIHVFSYSDRPDAAASGFEGKVDEKEKKRRMKKLAELAAEKQRKFALGNKGDVRMVLIESEEKDGYWEGYTENYIRVRVRGAGEYINKRAAVKITDVKDGVVSGELVC